MLKTLSVRNYALITDLTVEFRTGLTTITGETGAGKSILMGALSLILGNRADTTVLKDKGTKCVVEGVFQPDEGALSDWFRQHDLDDDKLIYLRREINPGGKSRAFVNDTPVTLPVMKDLGERLVNIHAQHENLMLNNERFAVFALDAFLKLDADRMRYGQAYTDYQKLHDACLQQKRVHEEQLRNRDFIEFQLSQLTDARLEEEAMTDLEAEREVLEHAEEIRQQIGQVVFRFDEQEPSLLSEIKQALQSVRSVSSWFAELNDPLRRLDESYVELKEIIVDLNHLLARVESDPSRLQYVVDRLDLLYALEQKHQVNGIDELIRLRDAFSHQLDGMDLSGTHIQEMEAELSRQYEALRAAGQALSAARMEGMASFCDEVVGLLHELGMPHARFEIRHNRLEVPGPDGMDEMELLFAANKNQAPEVVGKVASGGEISRLMLSIKALISRSLAIPTLIFDEIDAGVSGEIADRMGQLIHRISDGRQVLNITHLPQVARSGDAHYLVYKYDDETTTHTAVKKLNKEERITELAKMLSGQQLTEEALNHARQLLN